MASKSLQGFDSSMSKSSVGNGGNNGDATSIQNGNDLLACMFESFGQKHRKSSYISAEFQSNNDDNNMKNNFQTCKVFGRENELQQLMNVFHSILSAQKQRRDSLLSSKSSASSVGTKMSQSSKMLPTRRRMALVHGVSGVGKSTLVQTFVKNLPDDKKPFVVSGKFDQLKAHVPYAALMQAANDLARQLFQRRRESSGNNEMIARIRQELGPELLLLCTIIEPLSAILEEDDDEYYDNQRGDGNKQNTEKNKDREQEEEEGTITSTTSDHGGRGRTSRNKSPSLGKNTRVATSGQAFARFKLLIRTFFRSIASADTPIVIFLDDLQWADLDTLELIQSLRTDTMSEYIMIIGAYRDDQVGSKTKDKNDNSSFKKFFFQPQEEQDDTTILEVQADIVDIAVSNLQYSDLNEMIASVLHVGDSEQTRTLTDVILSKTLGNPFHVLNFMDKLQSDGLLTMEERGNGALSWTWDADAIARQCDVADNLARILEARLLRLPEKVRSILQLASFVGHHFSADILTTIVHAEQDMIEASCSFDVAPRNEIQERITRALKIAVHEGLLEGHDLMIMTKTDDESGGTFKFSHDCIQQCLYEDLITDDYERKLLHRRIGKQIWKAIKKLQSSDNGATTRKDIDHDWMTFLAADNLNRGPEDIMDVDHDLDRVEAVELNRRAANLASKKAAFLVSAQYLRSALRLARCQDFFTNHSEEWLALHREAAEVERTVGSFHKSYHLAREIHNRARNLEDEFPAYLIEIKTHAAQGNLKGAMKLAFRILSQLGVRFPKKITQLTIIMEFVRTKMLIGQRHPAEMASLPVLDDTKKLNALELLSALSIYSFFIGESEKNTFVAVQLRMAYLTVRFGLSKKYAPQAFVGYGSVCCFLGDLALGLGYREIAMGLQSEFGTDSNLGMTQILAFSLIDPWTHGMDVRRHVGFKEGYHTAMLSGDVDNAHWGILGWIISGFYIGMHLHDLVQKAGYYCLEMEELGTNSHLMTARPIWQMLFNLHGDDENTDPSILCGSALFLDSFEQEVLETKSATILNSLRVCEIVLAMHFENWSRLRALYPQTFKVLKTVDGYWSAPCSYAFVAWAACRLYEQYGNSRYKKQARKLLRTLKIWANNGSPIASAMSKFIQVGEAAFLFPKRKDSIVKSETLYLDADRVLGDSNFSVFQTLASEAMADVFASHCENEKSIDCLDKSLSVHSQWGANEKIRHISKKQAARRNLDRTKSSGSITTPHNTY